MSARSKARKKAKAARKKIHLKKEVGIIAKRLREAEIQLVACQQKHLSALRAGSLTYALDAELADKTQKVTNLLQRLVETHAEI